jgi:hypothetical protein
MRKRLVRRLDILPLEQELDELEEQLNALENLLPQRPQCLADVGYYGNLPAVELLADLEDQVEDAAFFVLLDGPCYNLFYRVD